MDTLIQSLRLVLASYCALSDVKSTTEVCSLLHSFRNDPEFVRDLARKFDCYLTVLSWQHLILEASFAMDGTKSVWPNSSVSVSDDGFSVSCCGSSKSIVVSKHSLSAPFALNICVKEYISSIVMFGVAELTNNNILREFWCLNIACPQGVRKGTFWTTFKYPPQKYIHHWEKLQVGDKYSLEVDSEGVLKFFREDKFLGNADYGLPKKLWACVGFWAQPPCTLSIKRGTLKKRDYM